MKICNYVNGQIKLTEEATYVKAIRDLFNADKSKDKEKFMQTMSVVYFMTDPRSIYIDIINDNDRLQEIIRQEGLPTDYKIDQKTEDLMEVYKKYNQTAEGRLLIKSQIAADKIGDFLQDIDLYAVDDKGKPIYTINSVTAALDKVPTIAKKLVETRKTVMKEIESSGRIKGGETNTAMYEGGID